MGSKQGKLVDPATLMKRLGWLGLVVRLAAFCGPFGCLLAVAYWDTSTIRAVGFLLTAASVWFMLIIGVVAVLMLFAYLLEKEPINQEKADHAPK